MGFVSASTAATAPLSSRRTGAREMVAAAAIPLPGEGSARRSLRLNRSLTRLQGARVWLNRAPARLNRALSMVKLELDPLSSLSPLVRPHSHLPTTT